MEICPEGTMTKIKFVELVEVFAYFFFNKQFFIPTNLDVMQNKKF